MNNTKLIKDIADKYGILEPKGKIKSYDYKRWYRDYGKNYSGLPEHIKRKALKVLKSKIIL